MIGTSTEVMVAGASSACATLALTPAPVAGPTTACGNAPAPPTPVMINAGSLPIAPNPVPVPLPGRDAPDDRPARHRDLRSPVLNLADWHLTLPTGQHGDPDDVYAPDLGTYTGAHFRLDDGGNGVVFTAEAGGATTKAAPTRGRSCGR